MRGLINKYMICLLLFTSLQVSAQQRDTTSNGEELLLASELFKKSDEERRLMLLKPRFRYINKEDKRRLFKMGYRPAAAQFSGTRNAPPFIHSLIFSYERKIGDSPFSLNLESLTRLDQMELGTYDYKIRPDIQNSGSLNGLWYTSGEFFNHRFRLHATLRYYYNLRKRLEAEVSGHNMASEYFFFRLRDVLNYSEVDDLMFDSNFQLSNHVLTKKWVFRPAYFSVGWGIQRPFFGKLLVDVNAEVGRRIPFSSGYDHFYKDFVVDINIFIGLGF
ncbi:MAG: hypothetical protein HEP71_20805 [Roseivirga sp.]|nr:hypothetical protein [Roseivirga sp.]